MTEKDRLVLLVVCLLSGKQYSDQLVEQTIKLAAHTLRRIDHHLKEANG